MDSNEEGRSRIEAPLALIERLDRDGHVLQSTLVYRWPMKIGRSFEADLVLDDPHLAPLHAELDEVNGQVHLRVGETINGAVVGNKHLQAGEAMALDVARALRLGNTRLRVRLASEPMAPERPLDRHLVQAALAPVGASLWRVVLPLLLISLLSMLFDEWLDNDPGTPLNNYLSSSLILLGVTMGWALFWSLGSKLFQGKLDYLAHLRLTLIYGLVWTVLDAVLPLLAFATDWSFLSHVSGVVGAGVLCALVWAHLGLILPGHRAGVTVGVATMYLVGLGLHIWLNEQRTGQAFTERYVTALPPPAWRLASAKPASVLIQDARDLKDKLDRQAKEDQTDDAADAGVEE